MYDFIDVVNLISQTSNSIVNKQGIVDLQTKVRTLKYLDTYFFTLSIYVFQSIQNHILNSFYMHL